MSTTATDVFGEVINRSNIVIQKLRNEQLLPSGSRQLKRRFSVNDTAKLVGRNRETIRNAEKTGKIPSPDVDDKKRRIGYTLEQINIIRKYFDTLPRRNDSDEPCILSIQNFKGGVAKTVLSTHIAQYMALQGYRVLLVDCDSQATATAAFGYLPDDEIDAGDTLYPFLTGDKSTLEYAIRKTHWDGLDLIPSCLMLYGVEYQLAGMQARSTESGFKFYEQLSLGLETIKNNYDVIIIDSPPALGMMSLNILYAANALIIPTPPALYDFSSTKQFFTALIETIGAIGEINLKFFRVLLSRFDITSDAQNLFASLIRDTFSNMCMDAGLLKTDEILKASGLYTTVYELDSPTSSRKTYNRAMNILNGVCSEVESLIRQTWPSHVKKMREQGIV